MEMIPHRPPTLLIDRVLLLEPGRSVRAIKAIAMDATWYEQVTGPDFSYPRSLLFESFGQAAALLLTETWRPGGGMGPDVPILAGAAGVRFNRPVLPGDTVQHRVEIVRLLDDSAIVHGFSTVGESTVMEIERVILALRPSHDIK